MRKTTKLLSLVLAALMLVGMCTVSAGAKFDDVSVEDEALYDAVELLSTLGVAKGTTETTFGPDENVTRQQMAAFIYRLMKAGRSAEGGTNDSGFTDLDDSTFFHMITWASQTGVIKGRSATTFDPKGGITLQDAYVMLVRALGYEDDTVLPYPFGYIDLAEEIGLDENIPSTVNYTDTLNRGNVAILLANAFYAEMNKTTVEYKFISNKYFDANGDEQITWAYAAVETAATVAKDIFGVVEETFEVKATNNYSYGTTVSEDEIEMLKGNRYDVDGKLVKGGEEWKLSDFGLEGKADDYFLADITLFVKKDAGKDVTKDVVVAAKSNLVKKTVAASDIVIDRSTKTDAKYYENGVKSNTNDKVMTGLISFGKIDAYLDADAAPYAYKSLGINGNNKPSVNFITLDTVTNEEGVAKFAYTNKAVTNYDNLFNDADNTTGAYDKLNKAFKADFGYVYNDGLYEAEVYDVDGDGYAEHIFFKQYDFIKMFDKNTKYYGFTDVITTKDKTTVGGVKKEDIIVTGEWNDGDAVLVYAFDNAGTTNTPSNYDYVEVKEVITSIETSAKTHKKTTAGDSVYTFTTGETVDYTDAADKIVGGAATSVFGLLDPTIIWVKGDVLLYTSTVSASEFDTTADYALFLENTTKQVNRVVDGEYKTDYYVKVVADGTAKMVLIGESVNTYNKYDASTNTWTNGTQNLNTVKVTDKTVATIIGIFYNNFASYTVNDDGSYTFTETKFNGSMNDNIDATDYYTATTGTLKHVANSVYEINGNKVALQDYSKVIIESTDDDGEPLYTVYTASTLGRHNNTTLNNIKLVRVNNTKGDIENVGIMYAKLPASSSFGDAETNDYRIILSSYEEKSGSVTKNYLELFNIIDGSVETVVAANTFLASDIKNNRVVEVREDGKAHKLVPTTIGPNNGTAYDKKVIFNKTFSTATANYDSGMKLLTFNGDNNMYTVDDETTFVYYESSTATNEVADVSILTNKGNTYNDKFNDYEANGNLVQEGKFSIHIVAEDDVNDLTNTVKIVKNIVVCPVGVITY